MNEGNIKQKIRQAVGELDIDVPIMNYRVVGDRLELYLYGGGKVDFAIAEAPAKPSTAGDRSADALYLENRLKAMLRKDLILLGTKLMIRYRTRMNKKELIEALLAGDHGNVEDQIHRLKL